MAKKKKQSKLRRVISALNPTNPKGMALLFACIFALSGAGVYLYQSFASINPQTITYYYDSDANGCSVSQGGTDCNTSVISHSSTTSSVPGGVQYPVVFDIAKNAQNSSTWAVTAPGDGYDWSGPNSKMTIPAGGKGIKACFRYVLHNESNVSGMDGTVTLKVDVRIRSGIIKQKNVTTRMAQWQQSGSKYVIPTDVTCLYIEKSPGTILRDVQARFDVLSLSVNSKAQQAGVHLVRTSLSYY